MIEITVDGENLNTIIAHYDSLPILLRYIIKKKGEGDIEAYKVLNDWDASRVGKYIINGDINVKKCS